LVRFLSKDLLSGLMFIIFGMVALYFGQKLALGTPVRMGPGYVPRMLSFILLSLGSIIVLATLFRQADRREKERYWIPVAAVTVAIFVLSLIPWGANFISDSVLGEIRVNPHSLKEGDRFDFVVFFSLRHAVHRHSPPRDATGWAPARGARACRSALAATCSYPGGICKCE